MYAHTISVLFRIWAIKLFNFGILYIVIMESQHMSVNILKPPHYIIDLTLNTNLCLESVICIWFLDLHWALGSTVLQYRVIAEEVGHNF